MNARAAESPARIRIARLLGLAVALATLLSCSKHAREEKPRSPPSELTEPMTTPGWLTFKSGTKVAPKTLFKDHPDLFHLAPGNEMKLSSERKDELGITHLRYQQFYRGVKVEGAEYLVRARDGWAISANGHLAYDFKPQQMAPQIAEERAW